jgi:hypothetical protein
LIAGTGEEVVAREIFDRFKRFADHVTGMSMVQLIARVHDASRVYRDFVAAAAAESGPIDRLGLFGYRTGVLESEVIKPLVLCLMDPAEPPIPDDQFVKTLDVVESWMVRRMLVRASTKSYSQVVAELVSQIRNGDRQRAGDVIEGYLRAQSSGSRYWPDDDELRQELDGLQAYRRLGRGRLRMVLEAVEDNMRGWSADKSGLGGERVARGKYAIEHVMPRKWMAHWPLLDGAASELERDRLIHTLGNLTLLTGRLNSKVSNAAWLGQAGKRKALEAHDVLLLNRELLKTADEFWNDASIRARTRTLADTIVQIWPVPEGHRSGFVPDRPRLRRKLRISDLINAGKLEPGMSLFPRHKKYSDRIVLVLADGQVEVDGEAYSSPSEAAASIRGRPTNGWWFFLVDQASKRSLRMVRSDYLKTMALDAEDDEGDDYGDDDEQ